jgi:hypothetical protein
MIYAQGSKFVIVELVEDILWQIMQTSENWYEYIIMWTYHVQHILSQLYQDSNSFTKTHVIIVKFNKITTTCSINIGLVLWDIDSSNRWMKENLQHK